LPIERAKLRPKGVVLSPEKWKEKEGKDNSRQLEQCGKKSPFRIGAFCIAIYKYAIECKQQDDRKVIAREN